MLLGKAAALGALSAIVLGGAACTTSTAPAASVSEGTATSARTGPVISPPPVTPATPPGSSLAPFACKDASGGSAGSTGVTAVRTDEQPGYDRFVLQFDSNVPQYTIKRQTKPVFTLGPSGQTISLSGTAGVLIVLHSTSQSGTYSGPTDFPHSDFAVLKEARLTEDYEGTVTWGLGLGSAACMRVVAASAPARLVIDFQTPTS